MDPDLKLVRCRWVIAIWAVCFIVAIIAAVSMYVLRPQVAGFWTMATLSFIVYGGVAFGLYLACRVQKISIRRFVGPILPVGQVFKYALTAIPVFLSSLGGAWLIGLFAPHFFDGMVGEVLKNKPVGAFQIVPFFIMIVVVGPAIEEFTFRGLLFTRLSVKYSPRTAILLSSLMFGIMHFDFLGAFVFGLVAASLYAYSGSLIAPLALHCVNNLIAFGGFFADNSGEQLPLWIGLPGLLIAIAMCAWLFARWSRVALVPPYIAVEIGGQGAIS